MVTVTYTDARANFAAVLEVAIDDLEEVIITRAGHEPALLVSLREYESLKETEYLLRSPANARHLRASTAEARAGKAEVLEQTNDRKDAERINLLITDVARNGHEGIGVHDHGRQWVVIATSVLP